jgi:type II secretory pathway component PulM
MQVARTAGLRLPRSKPSQWATPGLWLPRNSPRQTTHGRGTRMTTETAPRSKPAKGCLIIVALVAIAAVVITVLVIHSDTSPVGACVTAVQNRVNTLEAQGAKIDPQMAADIELSQSACSNLTSAQQDQVASQVIVANP